MRPAEYWLRCGECGQYVKRDYTVYWCTNRYCSQAEHKLPITGVVWRDQFVERERRA